MLQWLKVLNDFVDEDCPDDTFGDKLDKFMVEYIEVKKTEENSYCLDAEEFYIVTLKMLKFGLLEMDGEISESGHQLFDELLVSEDTEIEVVGTKENKTLDIKGIAKKVIKRVFTYETLDGLYKIAMVLDKLKPEL